MNVIVCAKAMGGSLRSTISNKNQPLIQTTYPN